MPDPFGDRLSFVSPRSMWAPSETGKWSDDNRKGAHYASELIDFIKEAPARTPMLGHVVRDMVQRGKFGAVEVGFFHLVSATLANPQRSTLLPR